MEFQKALNKLKQIDQEQLLRYWNDLTQIEKKELLSQIDTLDVPFFLEQRKVLSEVKQKVNSKIEAFNDYVQSGDVNNQKIGWQLISEGKVGCILMAGGQGSRLHFEGPKGMFPITPITKKSLFQFFAEKVVAAGKQAGKKLPLAIMTSPLNDLMTKQFFSDNHYFGLEKSQLFFFTQGILPYLDQQGKAFLEEKGKIAEGPNGNGYIFKYFSEQGIAKQWEELGVEYVTNIQIDNPLADPFDAELIGFHSKQSSEVTIKCAIRRSAEEKVGLVVKQEGRIRVIEYSEISDEERTAYNEKGLLKHLCANLSMFCFNLSFIYRIADKKLPLHAAFKSTRHVTASGEVEKPKQPFAWKYETFIFDLLTFAKGVDVLLYPREECFAPLKNFSGEDSLETVQQALEKQAKRLFIQVTGREPPSSPLELPMDFFYHRGTENGYCGPKSTVV